jgi:hypothetical protein
MKWKLKKRIRYSYHFQVNWFYQGLIEQYAIPILESLPIGLPMRTHIFHIWILKILQSSACEHYKSSDHKSDVSFRWIAGSHQKLLIYEQLANNKQVKRIPLFFLKFVVVSSDFLNGVRI